jgi:hypothetical protein
MNSTSTRELRMTMPPRAIIPIMLVAVKNTGFSKPPTGFVNNTLKSQNPGMMPMRVRGRAIMMRRGMKKEFI